MRSKAVVYALAGLRSDDGKLLNTAIKFLKDSTELTLPYINKEDTINKGKNSGPSLGQLKDLLMKQKAIYNKDKVMKVKKS